MEKQELTKLIRLAQTGNTKAFEQLVERYKGHVYRQALAMLHDRMEAEDVMQEAFVKAYFYLPKLGKEHAFVSWLTRIVMNLCYDKIKKMKRSIPVDDTLIEDVFNDRRPSSGENRQIVRMSVADALQRLSFEHREAVVLRDIQGFSYQEIADSLGIPLGTVKSRISLARKELKKFLTEG